MGCQRTTQRAEPTARWRKDLNPAPPDQRTYSLADREPNFDRTCNSDSHLSATRTAAQSGRL